MNAPRLRQLATLAPQFAAAATESAAYWSPEPPPLTLAADLAGALVLNVGRLPSATLQSAFELCEAAIVDGSPEEQAAFATGFLEALQHADGRQDFDFRSIVPFLGAASKAHCESMDSFHGVRTRGLKVRKSTKSDLVNVCILNNLDGMNQAPLTPRLSHAVRQIFAPAESEMATQRLLEGCSPERLAVSDGALIERIRAAALKRSGGSLSELEDALRLAGQDWRDLLMAAGFGEKLNAHDVWLNSATAQIP